MCKNCAADVPPNTGILVLSPSSSLVPLSTSTCVRLRFRGMVLECDAPHSSTRRLDPRRGAGRLGLDVLTVNKLPLRPVDFVEVDI